MVTVSGVTMIVAVETFVGSATEAALIVTVETAPTVVDGVKLIVHVLLVAVLPVWVAVPSKPPPPTFLLQLIPPPVSKLIVAVSGIATEPCPTVNGRVPLVEVIALTVIGLAVMATDFVFVGSSIGAALTVAVQAVGRFASVGAV
jgi:hypothetical protein